MWVPMQFSTEQARYHEKSVLGSSWGERTPQITTDLCMDSSKADLFAYTAAGS